MRPAHILALALAVLPAAVPHVRAHEGATGVVKERMDAMGNMSKTMKTIGRLIEANRNLATIQDEAGRIREMAARIPQWFPAGSSARPTEALPTIWTQWADFQAKAAQLEQDSAKLAGVAASGDPQAIAAQFRAVGQTCSGCHAAFRQKR